MLPMRGALANRGEGAVGRVRRLRGSYGAPGREGAADPPSAVARQVAEWEKTAARYRSEPETGEGTTELAERAQQAEHERDTALARYHHYEVAS
jgi:hypothetical protein